MKMLFETVHNDDDDNFAARSSIAMNVDFTKDTAPMMVVRRKKKERHEIYHC